MRAGAEQAVKRHVLGVPSVGTGDGWRHGVSGLRPMRPEREAQVRREIEAAQRRRGA